MQPESRPNAARVIHVFLVKEKVNQSFFLNSGSSKFLRFWFHGDFKKNCEIRVQRDPQNEIFSKLGQPQGARGGEGQL